ncbi:MAG: hypothetical protein ACRC06_04920 [Waterburya sp.]
MTQPFQFANGQVAHSAEDLLELCKQFPADGTNYLVREDLEKWLAYIGQNDIAQCAATARQAALEDRQKLEEFLNKCHALASPEQKSDLSNLSAPPQDIRETVAEPVETPEQQILETTEPPVIEQKEPAPVQTPTPVDNPSSVATESTTKSTSIPKSSETSKPSNSAEKKPSFFRIIARLIVNVLYRNRT